MGKPGSHLGLENLETYQLARKLSEVAWQVYSGFDWQMKKVLGDQFLTATDSVAANIAEGYGRYHYADKVKFYYNARASLFESLHWFKLLVERKLVDENVDLAKGYKRMYPTLSLKLNALIKSAMQQKKNS